MASAQLLYNINTTTKTTATTATRKQTTLHKSIENHLQTDKLSIFAETEAKGKTGYISNTNNDNDTNTNTNTNTSNNNCNSTSSGNSETGSRKRKQQEQHTLLHSKDSGGVHNKSGASWWLSWWWFTSKLEVATAAATASSGIPLSSSPSPSSAATFTATANEKETSTHLPTTTATASATTTTVFISTENLTRKQLQQDQQQQQQPQQLCWDSMPEIRCRRATWTTLGSNGAASNKATTTTQQSFPFAAATADDVNLGVQWQQFDGAADNNNNNNHCEQNSEFSKKCQGRGRSLPLYNNKTKNRTIQLQQQQQQELQANYYYSTDDNNEVFFYAHDDDDDDDAEDDNDDHKGIEDFNSHTTTTTTTRNTNTKMPLHNSQNNRDKENCQSNYKSHNFPETSDNAFLPQQQASHGVVVPTSKISIYDNNTSQQKCCQKSKNVVQQSCLNNISTHVPHLEDGHGKNTATSVAQHSTNSLSHSLKQQEQQQRNFSTISSNHRRRTAFWADQTTSATPPTAISSSATRHALAKFFMDLQCMAKCLLSLLVIFNMLPLFYAECDQTFVSRIGGPQNGTFSAPLLHNHKNHSRQCLYTFLAGPGQRVEVVFKSFNLRGNPPDGSAVGELPS
uniref:CUB domain-containing protein n=1 Tax=Stomoxys calcitrans TaxID=35570 RepID=A0A1I8NX60_STOCA